VSGAKQFSFAQLFLSHPRAQDGGQRRDRACKVRRRHACRLQLGRLWRACACDGEY